MKNYLATALFALLIAPVLSRAQGLGSIAGTITDPSGAAVASAKITAKEEGTGFAREAMTDEHGYYVIPSLRPATYSVSVQYGEARSYAVGRSKPYLERTVETRCVHGERDGQQW